MLLATALVLELARESLTGTHCRYRQYVDGVATETYITQPCDSGDLTTGAPHRDTLERLSATKRDGALLRVDGRLLRRVVRQDAAYERYAYDYDAATGSLVRRVPLFYRAKPARVFDPNPVVTLNDPTLQDRNDSIEAVPLTAYRDVELDAAPAGPLSGPYVAIVDSQARNVAPVDGGADLRRFRDDDAFEDVSAYFHIDRNQRYLQSLGYRGARAVAAYPVPVDAHAVNGADNSFFVPSAAEAGKGALFFGEGGTDDAEDADILIHEYTHAIHEWIAPGTFGGSFSSESRALAEGMADYWAYSAHVAARRASGRDPFCFADWDARCALDDASQRCGYGPEADCLRRLDSAATMAHYVFDDAPTVEHVNGAIWSSALREIHDRIGKREMDSILIESLFAAPPRPTFAVMARRLLEADRLLYQGAYAGAICSAMYTRLILAQCEVTPRGELTHYQSRERALPIPENSTLGTISTILVRDVRTIEKLQVRVDITHPSRGDLRVELTAPDGTVILLHQISSVRTANIRETYGVTAVPLESLDLLRGRSAAGLWKLTVSDRRPLDTGTLESWGLLFQFAGDQPLSVRPSGAPSQMIPVIGHLYGSGPTLFRSDVRIANPRSDTTKEAVLIFTRSGEDGTRQFSAVRLAIDVGQTIALEDVLQAFFHTAGSGSLEVVGDVEVMSRTDGQQVPPGLEVTGLGSPPVFVAPAPGDGRTNLGLTETHGASGVVRIRSAAGDSTVILEPFSHRQFPIVPGPVEIGVIEGGAEVSAYLSQFSRDGMFIPAERVDQARIRIAPAITGDAPGEQLWRSDAWFASSLSAQVPVDAIPGGSAEVIAPAFFEDVLARLFPRTVTLAALRPRLPAGVFGATRIVHGDSTQFVPFVDPEGPAVQHILFIETRAPYRTNIGVVSAGPASGSVIVWDAEGQRARDAFTFQTGGGVVQFPVRAGIVHGRAEVRFIAGRGRSYASVIDTVANDAMFVAGQ